MEKLIFILVTIFLHQASCLGHWNNDWDGPLNFQCKDEEAITRVKSIHYNHYEDRRFELFCTPVGHSGQRASCQWTSNFVNNYDEPVHYSCPGNSYMNGMYSVHDNHYEDRMWKFRCCSVEGVKLVSCDLTGWTNHWDQPQDYTAPSGYVITGSVSEHHNHYEDRRFKFYICKVVRRREETPRPSLFLEYLQLQPQEQPDEVSDV